MKSNKVGGGGRFAAFKRRLEGKGYSADSSDKIAASAERTKYGNAKSNRMSAVGRRRAMKTEEKAEGE